MSTFWLLFAILTAAILAIVSDLAVVRPIRHWRYRRWANVVPAGDARVERAIRVGVAAAIESLDLVATARTAAGRLRVLMAARCHDSLAVNRLDWIASDLGAGAGQPWSSRVDELAEVAEAATLATALRLLRSQLVEAGHRDQAERLQTGPLTWLPEVIRAVPHHDRLAKTAHV